MHLRAFKGHRVCTSTRGHSEGVGFVLVLDRGIQRGVNSAIVNIGIQMGIMMSVLVCDGRH